MADAVNGGRGNDKLNGDEADNSISGGAGNDKLYGGAHNDILKGDAGNDRLNGGRGDDVLDGGVDRDSMRGGAGDDTYVVDNVRDRISERNGEGTDTVESFVDWTLNRNTESLRLTGDTDIDGKGKSQDNVMTGNTGDNVLTGNGSNDKFVFNTGVGNDTVTDFAPASDTIDVSGIWTGTFFNLMDAAKGVGGNTVISIDGGTITPTGLAKAALSL